MKWICGQKFVGKRLKVSPIPEWKPQQVWRKEERMKRKVAVALLLILVLAFTGCGVNYEPTENGVFVKEDRTLEGAYIEDFDKDYYDVDALTQMGQQEVQKYNKEKSGMDFYSGDQTKKTLPVSLDMVSKRSDKILVRMSYATAEDYIAFNQDRIAQAGGTTIYTESLEKTSIPLTGEFVTLEGSPAQISEIAKNGSYHLVYVNYKENITVDGEIAYVSSNVTCNSKNNASTEAGQDSFIIFK